MTDEPFQEPFKETSPYETCNEKQMYVATMQPKERSMHLWRKVNPGCMQSTLEAPIATMKDQFKDREGLVRPTDKTHNRRKVCGRIERQRVRRASPSRSLPPGLMAARLILAHLLPLAD